MHAVARPHFVPPTLRSVDAPADSSAQDQWKPGLFVGGPADGEQGPLDGDRVTLVRRGQVHRYSVLHYESPEGEAMRAWIYFGRVPRLT